MFTKFSLLALGLLLLPQFSFARDACKGNACFSTAANGCFKRGDDDNETCNKTAAKECDCALAKKKHEKKGEDVGECTNNACFESAANGCFKRHEGSSDVCNEEAAEECGCSLSN